MTVNQGSGGGSPRIGREVGGADGEPGGRAPHIGVVGAGILGTVLALRLAEGGARVTLLERAPTPGGPRRCVRFRRAPHRPLLPRDRPLRRAHDRARRAARACRSAELHARRRRLLRRRQDAPLQRHRRLPALPAALAAGPRAPRVVRAALPAAPRLQRARARAAGTRGSRATAAGAWCSASGGPLLDSRFNSHHGELPATYLWARTNRMRSARDRRSAGETMGCLRGGHEQLVLAAAERAARARRRRPPRRRRRRARARRAGRSPACASTARTSTST